MTATEDPTPSPVATTADSLQRRHPPQPTAYRRRSHVIGDAVRHPEDLDPTAEITPLQIEKLDQDNLRLSAVVAAQGRHVAQIRSIVNANRPWPFDRHDPPTTTEPSCP